MITRNVKTRFLYILDLVPPLRSEFFENVEIPDDIELKIYKTFPGFIKALDAKDLDSPNIILFLPECRLDPTRIRQLRLKQLDSSIYIVTNECDERNYLTYMHMGINGIITSPFSKIDVNGVLNASRESIPFPRNNELIREGQVRLDFLLPSKLSRILGVNRLVSFLAAEFGFPQEEWRVNLPMVLDEALSNAIAHGNKGNENLKVHVRIYISSKRIKVQIEDQGEGFIPDYVDDPTDQENLYKGSGRGIYLMKELMDSVVFKNGGRLVEVEKLNPLNKD